MDRERKAGFPDRENGKESELTVGQSTGTGWMG